MKRPIDLNDENVLNVTAGLVLDGVKHARTLAEDTEINQSDLNSEFVIQAQIFSWWGTMSELARDIVNKKKTALRRLHAVLDHRAREANQIQRMGPHGKDVARLTETMVENIVLTDPEYIKAEADLLEAQKNLGLLQVGRDAMVMRKDMLISLGANYRAEGSADPVILKEAAKARARVMEVNREQSHDNSKRPVRMKK